MRPPCQDGSQGWLNLTILEGSSYKEINKGGLERAENIINLKYYYEYHNKLTT